MRIGLLNIDPIVARLIGDKLCGTRDPFISEDIQWTKVRRRDFSYEGAEKRPIRTHTATSEENYAHLLRKKRDAVVTKRTFSSFALSVLAGGVTGTLSFIMLSHSARQNNAAIAVATCTAVIGITVGRWWASHSSQRRALDYEILYEELKAVLPYLSLSRAERVYCDNVLMLSAFEANLEARRIIRQTLPLLNDLLVDSRKLEKKRKSLLPAIGTNPVSELAKEQNKLEDKYSATNDEVTRVALEQSIGHVKTRIENSSSLELALERLNAQQDAIINALSSAQGALARMQVAPSVQTDIAAREITETVQSINRQTVAVEEAVQELMLQR